MKLKIFLVVALVALIASIIFAINSFPKKPKLGEAGKVQLIPGQKEEYDKIQPQE